MPLTGHRWVPRRRSELTSRPTARGQNTVNEKPAECSQGQRVLQFGGAARDPRSRDAYTGAMTRLHRITQDPDVMGGRPCIRGLRVTVGTIVGLLAAGHDADEVLAAYPYLERDDIRQALAYAAWRSEEQEVAVGSS